MYVPESVICFDVKRTDHVLGSLASHCHHFASPLPSPSSDGGNVGCSWISGLTDLSFFAWKHRQNEIAGEVAIPAGARICTWQDGSRSLSACEPSEPLITQAWLDIVSGKTVWQLQALPDFSSNACHLGKVWKHFPSPLPPSLPPPLPPPPPLLPAGRCDKGDNRKLCYLRFPDGWLDLTLTFYKSESSVYLLTN